MITLPYSHTSPIHFSLEGCENVLFNPFTPESDQCQNSPTASQEIWHHTVWRTWLFIAYSDEKWLYYKLSLHHSYNCFLKGWENTLFELRSGRVSFSSCFVSTPEGDDWSGGNFTIRIAAVTQSRQALFIPGRTIRMISSSKTCGRQDFLASLWGLEDHVNFINKQERQCELQTKNLIQLYRYG